MSRHGRGIAHNGALPYSSSRLHTPDLTEYDFSNITSDELEVTSADFAVTSYDPPDNQPEPRHDNFARSGTASKKHSVLVIHETISKDNTSGPCAREDHLLALFRRRTRDRTAMATEGDAHPYASEAERDLPSSLASRFAPEYAWKRRSNSNPTPFGHGHTNFIYSSNLNPDGLLPHASSSEDSYSETSTERYLYDFSTPSRNPFSIKTPPNRPVVHATTDPKSVGGGAVYTNDERAGPAPNASGSYYPYPAEPEDAVRIPAANPYVIVSSGNSGSRLRRHRPQAYYWRRERSGEFYGADSDHSVPSISIPGVRGHHTMRNDADSQNPPHQHTPNPPSARGWDGKLRAPKSALSMLQDVGSGSNAESANKPWLTAVEQGSSSLEMSGEALRSRQLGRVPSLEGLPSFDEGLTFTHPLSDPLEDFNFDGISYDGVDSPLSNDSLNSTRDAMQISNVLGDFDFDKFMQDGSLGDDITTALSNPFHPKGTDWLDGNEHRQQDRGKLRRVRRAFDRRRGSFGEEWQSGLQWGSFSVGHTRFPPLEQAAPTSTSPGAKSRRSPVATVPNKVVTRSARPSRRT